MTKTRTLTAYEAERLGDARRWNETVERGNEIARRRREEADAEAEFEAQITALCLTHPAM